MNGCTAVLRQSIGELEGIQLDVGVAVGEALDQGSRDRLRPGGRCRHAIAYIEDESPVLRCQVLVRRLGCDCTISLLCRYIATSLYGSSHSLTTSSNVFA